MRTAAAWSFPCGGCFCPAGRIAAGRSCSHPPAYVSLTFAQKKTASVSLHQRFFHGRGWITQAALLKTAHWAVFALSSATAPQLFESTLESETSVFYKTKSPAYFHTLSIFGGRGWIRTTEAEKQQIYSLSPLATREHAHIQFFAVADFLYILPLGGVFVNCFLQLFQKRS